jgi:hypothetical protein
MARDDLHIAHAERLSTLEAKVDLLLSAAERLETHVSDLRLWRAYLIGIAAASGGVGALIGRILW